MIGLLKVRHGKSEQLDGIALRTKVDQYGDRLFVRHNQSEELPEY